MLFQNWRLSARKSRQAGDQPVQRVDGGEIRDTIHQSGAEMPLESSHGAFGFFAISACNFNAITINRQHRLQRFDRLAMIAALKKAAATDRSRLHPMADTVLRQDVPRKFFTRIDLADRCNIRM